MLVGPVISVFLGKSKVNNIYQITLFPQTHQEVVGLDVSVNEGTHVDWLYTTYLNWDLQVTQNQLQVKQT